jgi:hypothetical protein
MLLVVLGSSIPEPTLAVSVITVPDAVPAVTFRTMLRLALALAAREATEQVIVVAVALQLHPAGPLPETYVVFAGIGSLNVAPGPAAGPLLLTTWVNVMLLPAITVSAEGVLVTAISAVIAEATPVVTVAVLLARFGSFVPDKA